MMQGYDREEAVQFILSKVHAKDHPELVDMLPALVRQMIDADMEFMHQTDVLDEDGNAGDSYYEDDDAFEFIVEKLAATNQFTPEQAVKCASLVDDFMDYQEQYLEHKGLVDWD